LANKKRETNGAFRPPPDRMVSATTSIEDDEKSTTSEVDRDSLLCGGRGHISRRYRGTNLSTNLHSGELFCSLKISFYVVELGEASV
jgi:hypothetical protein